MAGPGGSRRAADSVGADDQVAALEKRVAALENLIVAIPEETDEFGIVAFERVRKKNGVWSDWELRGMYRNKMTLNNSMRNSMEKQVRQFKRLGIEAGHEQQIRGVRISECIALEAVAVYQIDRP